MLSRFNTLCLTQRWQWQTQAIEITLMWKSLKRCKQSPVSWFLKILQKTYSFTYTLLEIIQTQKHHSLTSAALTPLCFEAITFQFTPASCGTGTSDSVARVTLGNDDFTEWRHSNTITISDSRLELESLSKNLQTSDWQTQFTCTQRNELLCFTDYQYWC